jgi:hypothetical protein
MMRAVTESDRAMKTTRREITLPTLQLFFFPTPLNKPFFSHEATKKATRVQFGR